MIPDKEFLEELLQTIGSSKFKLIPYYRLYDLINGNPNPIVVFSSGNGLFARFQFYADASWTGSASQLVLDITPFPELQILAPAPPGASLVTYPLETGSGSLTVPSPSPMVLCTGYSLNPVIGQSISTVIVQGYQIQKI